MIIESRQLPLLEQCDPRLLLHGRAPLPLGELRQRVRVAVVLLLLWFPILRVGVVVVVGEQVCFREAVRGPEAVGVGGERGAAGRGEQARRVERGVDLLSRQKG